MTNAFVRMKRDGKWQSIEIDHLTDKELITLAEDQPTEGWVWAMFLVMWIRDNVPDGWSDVSRRL